MRSKHVLHIAGESVCCVEAGEQGGCKGTRGPMQRKGVGRILDADLCEPAERAFPLLTSPARSSATIRTHWYLNSIAVANLEPTPPFTRSDIGMQVVKPTVCEIGQRGFVYDWLQGCAVYHLHECGGWWDGGRVVDGGRRCAAMQISRAILASSQHYEASMNALEPLLNVMEC